MIKICIYISILIFILVSCNDNIVTENETDINTQDETVVIDENNLPDVLDGIPEGINIYHDPDSIYAEVYYKDTSRYVWKHSTIISTEIDSLKIIDFGTYNFKNGEWVLGNKTKEPYTSDEFEKWYFEKEKDGIVSWNNCKDGIMLKDKVYIDPSSWSVINQELVSRHGLWYYIGITPDGTKYMGYGKYVVLPELKPI